MEESSVTKSTPRWRRLVLGRRPAWTLARILILTAMFACLAKFVVLPVRIVGISMEPALHEGQINFINRLTYQWNHPQRGDVVGFRMESDGPIIIKRIIGLPGERLAFHSGTLYINGVSMPEPYLADPGTGEWPDETVPPDVFFVMGDNRMYSRQYRVDRSKILGKLCGSHP
jgi:signal peptidase I